MNGAEEPDLQVSAQNFMKLAVLVPSQAPWFIVKPMETPWLGNTVTWTAIRGVAASPEGGERGGTKGLSLRTERASSPIKCLKSSSDSATVKGMELVVEKW